MGTLAREFAAAAVWLRALFAQWQIAAMKNKQVRLHKLILKDEVGGILRHGLGRRIETLFSLNAKDSNVIKLILVI
jgi:hypothetical protein